MHALHRRLAILTVLPLAATVFQCQNSHKLGERHFDAPVGIAIGPAGETAPAHVFGFVSDPGHFAIRRIDLERRRVIEPRYPVGRPLGALVAHVGSSATVDKLWGVDTAAGRLISVDPALALSPTVSAPTISPSCCTLESVKITPGLTSTQTWTVTYRAGLDRWQVEGSGSGVQKNFARTNDGFITDQKEVSFHIRRGASPPVEGDRFVFATDNGVQIAAISTTASAINLTSVGGTTGLLVTETPPSIVAFDLASGALLQTFGLTTGARPAAIEVAADDSAAYLADLGNAVIYRLATAGPVSGWTLQSFPAPVPMRDIAVTGDNLRLHAMAADADDVFVFALPDLLPLDFDAQIPGFDPLRFPTAIRGLAGARTVHGSRGSGVPGYPIVVTSHAGNAFVLNGGTGCIDFDSSNGPSLVGARFRDAGLQSAPVFKGSVYHASACGGVTRTETWSFIYDGLAHVWRAKGSFSGPQVGVLTENVPYSTDRGEITVEIDSNTSLPSDDGDTFFLSVTDGIGPIPVGLIPSRPAFFTLPPDATGRIVERALVPNTGSDTISDLDLDRRRPVATYR